MVMRYLVEHDGLSHKDSYICSPSRTADSAGLIRP
jgi:hypothetical protein